ncbi:MAG: hypothetical protein U0263_04475 [Polyangiaceae bacterium]
MTLHAAQASATSLSVVWSSPGRAALVELTRDAGVWKLASPVPLESLPQGTHACPGHRDLVAANLEIDDGDSGTAALLTGTATLARTECSDDTGAMTTTGEVTLAGTADKTLPTAVLASAGGLLHTTLVLSEALEPTASASLAFPGENHQLSPVLEGGYVVGFTSARILPFGVELPLLLKGEDLAGVGAPSALVVQTPADFGVLTADGFESGSTQGLSGSALIVDGLAGEPAITGTKMLYVAPGLSALVRLERVGSEANVAFAARLVSGCPSFDGTATFITGVIGGAQRQKRLLSEPTPLPPPGDGGALQLGTQSSVLVKIPDPGKDVLLAITGEYYEGAGCAKIGVLVDDLRLE